MTDALSRYRQAEPSKDALKRYRDAPSGDTLGALAKYLGLQGYWDRQGQIAQDGLQMAEQGAQSVRGGNLSGLGGLALGPLNYFASPITALLPTSDETYAAKDIPEWAKPSVAGTLGAMAAVMPGPKVKGLGKGLNELGEAATDAERAALATRLEGEAAQTGGAPSAVTRGEAVGNLTETTLAQRIKAGWGDHAATQAWQAELGALSKEQIVALMKELGMRASSTTTKSNGITSIVGSSLQAARDADIAERIRRGQ